MNQLIIYLTFNGNCRSHEFYQACLGGELSSNHRRIAHGRAIAEKIKDFILHATLRNEHLLLMGTDMVGDQGLVKGNAMSILIECQNEAEIETYYHLLSRGGRTTHPIESTFWGALFGGLTDKYGNNWLLHCSKNQRLTQVEAAN
ncbi:MAG: VOC family protein [Haliscomenobacter sp.]|nr:VOC family protein [Haliscomenobacter sp.]MBK9492655.1 VOC family protein [Haliscomenobacter sp.]